MKSYISPDAELIEFEKELVFTSSGCTCYFQMIHENNINAAGSNCEAITEGQALLNMDTDTVFYDD